LNWQDILFKDFITLQRGHDLTKKEMDGGSYPVIGSSGIVGYHSEFKQSGPGVIIGRSGSIGTVRFIKENHWAHNTSLWVKDFKGNIVKFVYYFLKKTDLKSYNSGGAVPSLNRNLLDNIKVSLPPLPIQQKIASILSAYDDLIGNNLRRIELLEQSARELYKEWFVRFKFPGYEKAKFVDGLPEEWEKKKLGEVITLNYGKALKSVDRIPGDIPVYGSSGVIGSHSKYLVNGPGIIIGRKGNVGSVFWEYRDFYPIDTVYYISKNQSDLFAYYSLLSINFDNSDGAVPGLNRNYAYSRGFIKPLPDTISKFHEFIIPIHNQLNSLKNQNQLLKQARDLLLPRLMKSEIDV
jgi:type I restriction enzyme, S subunit